MVEKLTCNDCQYESECRKKNATLSNKYLRVCPEFRRKYHYNTYQDKTNETTEENQ